MQHPATADQARISEIFSSIQGEGTRLGERHIFIRFEECHIHCTYCDELDKQGRWMNQDEVLAETLRLNKDEGPHSFVSLTGGEPLLYLPFLKPLMMRLKRERFRTYLETNGILWKALEEVLPWSDCIAMDMKTSSVTKEANFDEDHYRFLEIANSKEVFVKIIVSPEISINEFENQIRIVASVNPLIPVVLVPISASAEGHEDAHLMQILSHLQQVGMRWLPSVRIVPRFHKILNVR